MLYLFIFNFYVIFNTIIELEYTFIENLINNFIEDKLVYLT